MNIDMKIGLHEKYGYPNEEYDNATRVVANAMLKLVED